MKEGGGSPLENQSLPEKGRPIAKPSGSYWKIYDKRHRERMWRARKVTGGEPVSQGGGHPGTNLLIAPRIRRGNTKERWGLKGSPSGGKLHGV